MKTKYLDFKNSSNNEYLKEASNSIINGNLVLFPTETVYGIGANGLDSDAVGKIFKAKNRESDNPLILHIANKDMLNIIAKNISDIEYKLMGVFWPGPFTLILQKQDIVPYNVTAGLETVAVRMPKNDIALKLIEYSNTPIAAPSANISGRPSGTTVQDIFDEFNGQVDYIIDGGQTDIGLESTVVKVIDNIPHILRPGKVTPEEIKKVTGTVSVDKNILKGYNPLDIPESPGVKYRHYAPDTKCILVYSKDNDVLVKNINELVLTEPNSLVISTTENRKRYNCNTVLDIGSKNNLDEISKNIYTTLRKTDKYNKDLIIIEGIEKTGLGLAIMNRLVRACEYNYIEV